MNSFMEFTCFFYVLMKVLLKEIRQCQVCLPYLDDGVNPVLAADTRSKIAIVGQAPGKIVHETGIPWDDESGKRLRQWLNMDEATFYNPKIVALIPMGFCYPGRGKSGDLPPRKECAPLWHDKLFLQMPELTFSLLVGNYAQKYYLKEKRKRNLTETVRNYQEYLPNYLPLPHPSPRNNIWLRKNPWFESDVIPFLQDTIKSVSH